MDLLCDADEYKLVRDHIDVVYYNGETAIERYETQKVIKDNINKLYRHNILSETKKDFVNECFFLF